MCMDDSYLVWLWIGVWPGHIVFWIHTLRRGEQVVCACTVTSEIHEKRSMIKRILNAARPTSHYSAKLIMRDPILVVWKQ